MIELPLFDERADLRAGPRDGRLPRAVRRGIGRDDKLDRESAGHRAKPGLLREEPMRHMLCDEMLRFGMTAAARGNPGADPVSLAVD